MIVGRKVTQIISKNVLELIVFIISLLIYLLTSSHSVVQGDTGEFLAVAATGGIPHEPGYPLYSLLTRIAYLLPFGHPAWQINVVSAIFAALALIFTFKIVQLITHSIPSALFAVFALGTYESFWFYALVAEIHTLHVFLLAMLFYFLVLAFKFKKRSYLYLAALTFGFGVSNNISIVLTIPSVLIVLWNMRKQLTVTDISKLVVATIVGLLPYSYTLYSSVFSTSPVSWGGIHDFPSFLGFVLRSNYGALSWAPVGPAWFPFQYSTFSYFFVSFFETSWYLLPLFLVSLFLLRNKNPIYIMLLSGFLSFGPLFYWLLQAETLLIIQRANTAQYLAYPFFFFAILSALGLHEILKRMNFTNIIRNSIIICLGFIPVLLVTWPKVRLDTVHLTQQLTKFQLAEVSKHGVLLVWGDGLYYPALYLQYVEGYRRDITIIQMNMFEAPWYRDQLRSQHPELNELLKDSKFNYIRACEMLANKDSLYLLPWYPENEAPFKSHCKVIPHGLMNKVVPLAREVDIVAVKTFEDKEWNRFSKRLPLSAYKHNYLRIRETLFYLAEQLNQTGMYYAIQKRDDWAIGLFSLARGLSIDEPYAIVNEAVLLNKENKGAQAISMLQEGIHNNPAVPELYKRLGLIYYALNQQEQAYNSLRKYVDFQTDDTDLPIINNFIWDYERRSFLH